MSSPERAHVDMQNLSWSNKPSHNSPSSMNLAPTDCRRFDILTEKVTTRPGRLMLALAQYEPELKDLLTSGLSKYIAHAAKNDKTMARTSVGLLTFL